MRPGRLKRAILPRVIALSAAAAFALARSADPSGETILRNVDARLASVHDYTVTLDVVADIERLNVPPMHATMYFKQPDRIHLDTEGFALLPREGLQPNVGRFLAKYSVEGVKRDSIDGVGVLRVILKAKSDRSFPRSVAVDVNPARWTIERIVTTGSSDRVATISFAYITAGGILMPGEMKAAFSVAAPDTTETEMPAGPMRAPQKPRNGSVTVRYSDYRLNTGLSDDIFAKDAPSR